MAATHMSGPFYVGGVEAIDENGNIVAPIVDTLAEGSMYIGDATNKTSEIDISGDGEMLIGTGTTSAPVALTGDVTIVNTGVTTVAALDLETATVTNIVDTELLIGTGAGTANFAALSGDATMTNAGVVTVTGATGNFTAGGDILDANGETLIDFGVTASAVNHIAISNDATGSSPNIGAVGADADINLILNAKGTGVLQFGTHAAIAAETLTGYITINDSGGTPRKVGIIS